MRSLTSLTMKLVLAFLITSVVGMLLAALFVRSSVARGFDDYVLDQRRAEFATEVGGYYATNGSWQGIERWQREQVQSTRRRPGAPRGGPPGLAPRFGPFALADERGIVVLPFEQHYRLGQRVEPGELARGTPVVVDDETVGTVLTQERPPFLSLAEQQYLQRIDRALLVAGAVTVGIALALGIILAAVITRPVRELTAAARRIAGGQLGEQVPVRSRDELGLLAKQFNQMSADLARANALRRQMTADIAHDLRTPLTVIAGYLEALRDQTLKPTVERFVTLYGEVQLLLRLVEDLHTLSLADAGELPLQRQPVAPAALLERVADSYRHAAEQQGIGLSIETTAGLPTISGDPERLARILGNLVSNALRHTPHGGRITLGGRVGPRGLRLTVSDTGPGIAPEHLPSIFERFYRVDAARSQAAGGSGLGLAIVRSLVEAHGGVVTVTSEPGQGTTFTIDLPTEGAQPVGGPARFVSVGGV